MTVLRIVPNVAVNDTDEAKEFYAAILGLEVLMDMGWIVTFGTQTEASTQISVMTQGGNETPVPDISIEVDDLESTLDRLRLAGHAPEYGPATEEWGVRRFFVRDPSGKLINILTHA